MWPFKRKKRETEEKPKEIPTKDEIAREEKAKNRYHVSQNKDEASEHYKAWRVRKEGSQKTIKYFATQKEAINHAKQLAKGNNSSVIIHKVDGKMRRKQY